MAKKTNPTPDATKAPELEGVQITSADRILYEGSGITKGDVARYYQAISSKIMPHLQGRIISGVRCPRGIESACFFQKHPTNDLAGVATVSIKEADGGMGEYQTLTDARGLLSQVQMNALEFHPWGSSVDTLEKPDRLVFDLDPDAGMDLESIRRGVRDLKGRLDQASLVSYLKTSGGKGYHVVVPLAPTSSWEKAHTFAQSIAKKMENAWPDRYTSSARKDRREGRIFIDWLRNGRGATSVAPYSLRAREGAPVSMPIAWKELDSVAPKDITMKEAVSRAAGKDPWEGFFTARQALKG